MKLHHSDHDSNGGVIFSDEYNIPKLNIKFSDSLSQKEKEKLFYYIQNYDDKMEPAAPDDTTSS